MGNLRTLLDDIADFLATDPFFREPAGYEIPVHALFDKEKISELEAIVDRLRIGCSVHFISAQNQLANAPGPILRPVNVRVSIYENRQLNDTAKDGDTASEYVAAMLHHRRFGDYHEPLIYIDTQSIDFDGVHVERAVNFQTGIGLLYAPEVVAIPTITISLGLVLIGTTTPDASIYYTLNGTRPTDLTGTLYTGQFASPPPGTVINARAYKSGLRASEIASLTVT